MPVTVSAKGALKKDRRRTIFNQRIRRQLKMVLKKARRNPTPKLKAQAASVLDRAAKKRVIHPNKAARLKSRLAKSAKTPKNSLSQAPKKKPKST